MEDYISKHSRIGCQKNNKRSEAYEFLMSKIEISRRGRDLRCRIKSAAGARSRRDLRCRIQVRRRFWRPGLRRGSPLGARSARCALYLSPHSWFCSGDGWSAGCGRRSGSSSDPETSGPWRAEEKEREQRAREEKRPRLPLPDTRGWDRVRVNRASRCLADSRQSGFPDNRKIINAFGCDFRSSL